MGMINVRYIFIILALFSGQNILAEDDRYQCLDAIEAAERFEVHLNGSGFANYLDDLFETVNVDGKQMTYSEIQKKLEKAGYHSWSTPTNFTGLKQKELMAKKAKALSDPEIAKLAKIWGRYMSEEGADKRDSDRKKLTARTSALHAPNSSSIIIPGTNSKEDTRNDEVSPRRPFGLITSRETSEGNFLYVLTSEGVRKIKIEKKEGRKIVAIKRVSDSSLGDSYPKVLPFDLKDGRVQKSYPTKSELKAAGVKGPNILNENPKSLAGQVGAQFIEADYEILRLNEESKKEDDKVIENELAGIIAQVTKAHKKQMEMLKGLSPERKARIKADFGEDEKWLAEIYTQKYEAAMQKCVDLEIGLGTQAIATLVEVRKQKNAVFPDSSQKGSGGGTSSSATR